MAEVSVIIPAYNAQDYIDECLNSVRSQTFTDIEILVVDDGSTDDTLSCVRRHVEEDGRIRIFSQANQFAGVARNKGMSEATGEFFYFLDADDWIEPDALQVMMQSAAEFACDIVIARSEGFDNQTGDTWILNNALNGLPYDSVLKSSDYADRLFQCFVGWPWDKLFRADFVRREGLEFQPLRTTNDAYFVFCALALASSVTCCDKVLFHHRSNNARSLEGSRVKSWHCALDAMVSIDESFKGLELYPALRQSFCNWVMNYSYWTVSTLPSQAGEAYLIDLQSLVSSMSLDSEYYPCISERLFRENVAKTRPQLLMSVVSLQEALFESERLFDELSAASDQQKNEVADLRDALAKSERKVEEIYQSRSYRLGNFFMKPLRFIKDHVG